MMMMTSGLFEAGVFIEVGSILPDLSLFFNTMNYVNLLLRDTHTHNILYIFSIYQSSRYPFSLALIGSRNSRYPKLLVDFEAEVKMTGSARAKNTKNVYIALFRTLKIKCILSNYFGKY